MALVMAVVDGAGDAVVDGAGDAGLEGARVMRWLRLRVMAPVMAK